MILTAQTMGEAFAFARAPYGKQATAGPGP